LTRGPNSTGRKTSVPGPLLSRGLRVSHTWTHFPLDQWPSTFVVLVHPFKLLENLYTLATALKFSAVKV